MRSGGGSPPASQLAELIWVNCHRGKLRWTKVPVQKHQINKKQKSPKGNQKNIETRKLQTLKNRDFYRHYLLKNSHKIMLLTKYGFLETFFDKFTQKCAFLPYLQRLYKASSPCEKGAHKFRPKTAIGQYFAQREWSFFSQAKNRVGQKDAGRIHIFLSLTHGALEKGPKAKKKCYKSFTYLTSYCIVWEDLWRKLKFFSAMKSWDSKYLVKAFTR